MKCPSCGSTKLNGTGELATCANPACARFVPFDVVDAAFQRLRSELTPEQRVVERTIRQSCYPHPRLFESEDS